MKRQAFPKKFLYIPGIGAVVVVIVGLALIALVRPAASTTAEEARLLVENPRVTEADLDRAVQLDPSYVGAYLKRAEVRLAGGKFDAALSDVAEALKLSPDSNVAMALRAKISATRGPTTQR